MIATSSSSQVKHICAIPYFRSLSKHTINEITNILVSVLQYSLKLAFQTIAYLFMRGENIFPKENFQFEFHF